MARVRSLVLLLVACSLPLSTLDAQKTQAPAVPEVLRAVTGYLAAHASALSGVTLREDYTALDVSGGRVLSTRRISSDLVLVDANGQLVALRDPFEVDGNSLRARTPRIANLLATPSQAAWEQAQAYQNEFARYFMDELIVRLNDPMLALRFVAPDNQARSTFKVDGRKKFSSVEALGLAFQETRQTPARYILDTPGHASARGRLWVEPVTGRVVRTEFSLQSDTETARIAVDYQRDPALDAWLPSSMVDAYEVTEQVGAGMNDMGSGSGGIARRSFDCRATYSKASYTPLHLGAAK